MQIHAIEGNTQCLDGGSMFGNAPKVLWEKWLKADKKNCITLSCRSLLLQTDEGKNIIFDMGVGSFFSPKLKERYGVMEEEHLLLKNLQNMGIKEEEIDAIILSHLHFDHSGGLLSPFNNLPPRLLFPNATIYTGAAHWERANKPHVRDRASFIPELNTLLKESGRLVLLEKEQHKDLPDFLSFRYVHGHTIGSIVSILELDTPLAFVADLIPGMPWMHLPITMGYDRFPELQIDEKKELLNWLLKKRGKVFFTHDPNVACAEVACNEKGHFVGIPIKTI